MDWIETKNMFPNIGEPVIANRTENTLAWLVKMLNGSHAWIIQENCTYFLASLHSVKDWQYVHIQPERLSEKAPKGEAIV